MHRHLNSISKLKKERVEDLLGTDANDTSVADPLVIMHSAGPAGTFYKLDWNEKLSTSLRHKRFMEFVSIEVHEMGTFHGVLLEEDGSLIRPEPLRKRRKTIVIRGGRQTMVGLIGDYGSEDEEEDGDGEVAEKEEPQNPLDDLGNYSDEEGESEEEEQQEYCSFESTTFDIPRGIDDDPELDWGDIDDELAEDEAKMAALDVAIRSAKPTGGNSNMELVGLL